MCMYTRYYVVNKCSGNCVRIPASICIRVRVCMYIHKLCLTMCIYVNGYVAVCVYVYAPVFANVFVHTHCLHIYM